LFDALIGGTWLERHNVENVAVTLGISCVPIFGRGSLLEAIEYTQIERASPIGSAKVEGLVMRPATELCTRMGKRVIAKVKHRDFA
jgi:hypothetical protein